ncbi:transposase [Nocardia sp. NPDC049707]|uniref:transposase n=1 Tax=Nocardia sp. NPDC049707 TaxID=3154735 RepID=UPI00341F98F3
MEPLLPRNKKAGRPPPQWTKRQIIDGIRWRTRVGCPWRSAHCISHRTSPSRAALQP